MSNPTAAGDFRPCRHCGCSDCCLCEGTGLTDWLAWQVSPVPHRATLNDYGVCMDCGRVATMSCHEEAVRKEKNRC